MLAKDNGGIDDRRDDPSNSGSPTTPSAQRIQGVKKTIKMLKEYQPHLMMVQLMHTMNAMLQHAVTHDGETLAENPRKLPPLPPGQEADGIQDDETWQSLRYHSALGNYANVFVDDILVYSQ